MDQLMKIQGGLMEGTREFSAAVSYMPKHNEFANILFNPSSDIGLAQYMKSESNAA
jgi:hypothetical protein